MCKGFCESRLGLGLFLTVYFGPDGCTSLQVHMSNRRPPSYCETLFNYAVPLCNLHPVQKHSGLPLFLTRPSSFHYKYLERVSSDYVTYYFLCCFYCRNKTLCVLVACTY